MIAFASLHSHKSFHRQCYSLFDSARQISLLDATMKHIRDDDIKFTFRYWMMMTEISCFNYHAISTFRKCFDIFPASSFLSQLFLSNRLYWWWLPNITILCHLIWWYGLKRLYYTFILYEASHFRAFSASRISSLLFTSSQIPHVLLIYRPSSAFSDFYFGWFIDIFEFYTMNGLVLFRIRADSFIRHRWLHTFWYLHFSLQLLRYRRFDDDTPPRFLYPPRSVACDMGFDALLT